MIRLIILLLFTYSAQALELDIGLKDKLQVHGFASQNYIYTTDNNFFGYSHNMGSLDFTEVGLNGSLTLFNNLRTAMQILYRRAGATDEQYVRVDFGFADYSIFSDTTKRTGIRAGRVINPYGLYNDTRDMPFTRPSILLPQSIYFDINRNFALSMDGTQVYAEHDTKIGHFNLQINGGLPRLDDPEWKPTFNTNKMNGNVSWIGRLMYEWGQGRIRMGISSGQFNASFLSNNIHTDFTFQSILFSLQYNSEDFTFTSEYAIRGTNLKARIFNTSFTGESYYVQGAYRITPDIEAYTRYDLYFTDRSDRNGKKYEAQTGLPSYLTYAKDLTAGLRWDINDYVMLRAEYHYTDGAGWLSFIENKDLPNISRYWSMAIVGVSLRF